ncbi:MAG: PRC-barrel domain-containing protein [Actinobacteria bacterium]|nr:PRC-barrel domain-containing protein [Actinomycetota bacterium]
MVDRGDVMDPLAGLKEDNQEYTVYDSHYEKIGKVDDLIVSEDDRVLYVGVKMGFLGTNSTLVPADIIRVNDRRQLIEVSEPAETIRHAPHFGRSEDLTPELENHVRTYFGLENLRRSPEHEPQGPDITEAPAERPGSEDWVETVPIERVETVESPAARSTSEEPRQEDTPERVEHEEHTPEHPTSEDPISERLSDEPESRWDSWRSDSGVTVHRIRR